MSINKEDKLLTNAERAEIERRKLEMDSQKKTNHASSLSDLTRELGLPDDGNKR